MAEKLKIYLVDNNKIFRFGVKTILKDIKGLSIIGEASNGEDFLEALKKTTPNIVLIDINLPNKNGVDIIKSALKLKPEIKIIVLSSCINDECIQSTIDAGVKGYLLKNIEIETIEKAINSVASGSSYHSEELWEFFTRKLIEKNKKPIDEEINITKREKEVLQLITIGYGNKEISKELFISERTVINHKANLLSKTGCKTTVSLMAFAIKNKLTGVE